VEKTVPPTAREVMGVDIIRVFPRRTEMTPLDDMAFSPKDEHDDGDLPPMWIPDHDEVHICTVFTWDKARAEEARRQWQVKTNKPVLIGGPAFDALGGEFMPGQYVRRGITITSRGCSENCSWCHVPRREGKIRLLPIVPGKIEQSNNLLACPVEHRRAVYDMQKGQRQVEYRGGLQAARLTDWDIEEMRGLSVGALWIACDCDAGLPLVKKTIGRLKTAGFSQNKIRCYVLIGDNREKNEARLRSVYEAGALPFAQLFQPEERIEYSDEWKQFARQWSRPAIYKSIMRGEVVK
jgi:hypothetical protein